MDSNVFNKIFISQFNKNHFLDSSFMVNDSIFESNYIHPFYIENAINPIQIKESYLNDSNNLELNNNQIISDTTKPFGEMNSCPKKVKVPDNCFLDNNNNSNNNFKEHHNQDNNLIKKESFEILDSHESKIFSQQKKKRGRKSKKIDNSCNGLNKFSNDNNIRKCKSLVLTYSLEFLNYQIKKIYNGNIGHGVHIKKLLDISQECKADNTINYMRKFINKTLKDIFSVDISKKYTSFLSNHNEVVINKILKDNDDDKRKKFEKLFSLTFIDCLKRFNGENIFEEFEGFPTFDEIKLKLNEDSEYIEKIRESLINFEDTIKNIKPRNTKTKRTRNE